MKPNQVKTFLLNCLKSNEQLIDNNKVPIAVNIEGVHGIGKTQVIKELAGETGYFVRKVNLAEKELVGDLTGYAVKEFEMCKGDDCIWITENQIPNYIALGWIFTNNTMTKQCPPDWAVDLPERTILLLDDHSRANSLIIQATMELINCVEFQGWSLPKYCQIILSTNPDNGEYNVTSLDGAQSTRCLNIKMEWDVDSWAEWSEKNKRDDRCINFVLLYPELFTTHKDGNLTAVNNICPRQMDKFFDMVETIDEFFPNIEYISQLAIASVGETFLKLFIKFINEKLDRLPSIPKIVHEYDLPTAKTELTKVCGNYLAAPHEFKQPTAATLSQRLSNYVIHNSIKKEEAAKVSELICHTAFTEDMKYTILNRISGKSNMFTEMMKNKELVKYVLA